MTEPISSDGLLRASEASLRQATKDNLGVGLFESLKNDPKQIMDLMAQVPADRKNDFAEIMLDPAMVWKPGLTKDTGSDRPLLRFFENSGQRVGAKIVKAALDFPVTDKYTGMVTLLYPRFKDGQFDPAKSRLLIFNQYQTDSLEKVLKDS